MLATYSQIPIYEQLQNQIKKAILKGDLQPGVQLPSIRVLAVDLKVGIITIKRAYAELEKDGFLVNKQGKGCFVNQIDLSFVKLENEKMLQERFVRIYEFCMHNNITQEEAIALLKKTWRE